MGCFGFPNVGKTKIRKKQETAKPPGRNYSPEEPKLSSRSSHNVAEDGRGRDPCVKATRPSSVPHPQELLRSLALAPHTFPQRRPESGLRQLSQRQGLPASPQGGENPSAWGSTGPQEQPPRLHAAGKDRTKGWHLQRGGGVQPDGGRSPFPKPCPALPHPAQSQFSISHHVLSC